MVAPSGPVPGVAGAFFTDCPQGNFLKAKKTMAEAKRIAKHLIGAKLAACVNITQPVQSIYRWEGRIAHDQEVLMVIKSTRELFPEVKAGAPAIKPGKKTAHPHS